MYEAISSLRRLSPMFESSSVSPAVREILVRLTYDRAILLTEISESCFQLPIFKNDKNETSESEIVVFVN